MTLIEIEDSLELLSVKVVKSNKLMNEITKEISRKNPGNYVKRM